MTNENRTKKNTKIRRRHGVLAGYSNLRNLGGSLLFSYLLYWRDVLMVGDMKPYGEGKEYGRIYNEEQAARVRARKKIIVTEEKLHTAETRHKVEDRLLAKEMGISLEELNANRRGV